MDLNGPNNNNLSRDGIDGSSIIITGTTSTSSSESPSAGDDNKIKLDEKNSEMFCSLLEMMKMSSLEDIAQKLCLMSQLPLLCKEMRNYGYLPMLVRLLHQHSIDDHELDPSELQRTSKARRDLVQALSNIISHTKRNKKEIKVLKILEDLEAFVEILYLRFNDDNERASTPDSIDHPCNLIVDLYKMCTEQQSIESIELFGGVYVISEVIKIDFKCHKDSKNEDCYKIRLYSLMILTHLTYNNPQVKSLLGSKKSFLIVLIELLKTSTEDLIQSVANVLQNLSWDSNYISMQTLRDVQAVTHLTNSLLKVKKESTIKCLLAALGNLTASSPPNKANFCKVDGGLNFLISALRLTTNIQNSKNENNKMTSISMPIVEASGFILRNISSYLATEEKYRRILREHKVIPLLLDHLESSSLDVVTNACVILSNLSACTTLTEESSQDQMIMIESNAVKKLANLKNSKHKIIREGALAAYKHLVTSHSYTLYSSFNENHKISTSLSFSSFPMRKMKALKNEISNIKNNDHNHSEKNPSKFDVPINLSKPFNFDSGRKFSRSTSHDSIRSTYSESKTMTLANIATYQQKNFQNNLTMINGNNSTTLRNCDSNSLDDLIEVNNNGVSSKYDIYCGDAKCQISRQNSTTKQVSSSSSSFIQEENELDELDYTTDYSERYKEQTVDDDDECRFPHSSRHHHRSSTTNVRNSGNVGNGGGVNVSGDTNKSTNQAESVDEDSVKIYQTEGTPLVFSLASSLSDLREIDLKSIYEEDGKKNTIIMNNKKHKSFNHMKNLNTTIDSLITNFSSSVKLKDGNLRNENKMTQIHQKKKSILPPKPNVSSVVTSNRVNKMTISDDNQNNDSEWTKTEMKTKNTSKTSTTVTTNASPVVNTTIQENVNHYFHENYDDSAIKFETEDTPAIFSHATSLSSLTMDDDEENIGDHNRCHDDDPDDEVPINILTVNADEQESTIKDQEELSRATVMEKPVIPPTSSPASEQRLDPIGSDYKSKIATNDDKENGDERQNDNEQSTDGAENSIKQKLQQTDSTAKNVGLVQQSSPSNTTPALETNTKSTMEPTIKKTSKPSEKTELIISDEDDDQMLLKKFIECALPSQKKPGQMSSGNHYNGGNGRVYSKKSRVHNKTQPNHVIMMSHTPQQQSPVFQKSNNIDPIVSPSNSSSAIGDQKKQFFVENTPVQLSECHSSLSSLSFDSDNGNITTTAIEMMNKKQGEEVDDNQLLAAAINLGINSNIGSPGNAISGSASTNIGASRTVSSGSASSQKQQQKNVSKTTISNNKSPTPSSFGQKISSTSFSIKTNPKIMNNRRYNRNNRIDDFDDEKTYTICTQASRQSTQNTTLSPTNNVAALNNFDSEERKRKSADGQSSTNPQSPSSATSVCSSPRKPKRNNNVQEQHQQTTRNQSLTVMEAPNKLTKSIPIPSTRTTIQSKNSSSNANNANAIDSDNGSLDERSVHSLLENTKPPSIMDHHSLMSQSSASIDSEISDIGFDQIPIRKSCSGDLVIAAAASNCAKEINTLVQSCMTNGDRGGDTFSSVKDSSSSLSTDLNLYGVKNNGRNRNNSNDIDNRSSDDNLLCNDRTFEINDVQQTTQQQQSRTLPKMKFGPGDSYTGRQDNKFNHASYVSDTRTYNKSDIKRNAKNEKDQQQSYNHYESDQSDTDISEVLPLDDVEPATINLNTHENKKSNNNSNQKIVKQLPNKLQNQLQPQLSKTINTTVLYNKPNIDLNPDDDPFLQMLSSTFNRSKNVSQNNNNKSLPSSSSFKNSGNNKKIYPVQPSTGSYQMDEFSHQMDKLEDLESETRYCSHSRNRNNQNNDMEEVDFSNQQLFYPFGGSSPVGSSGSNFTHSSRSLNRGLKFMNTKADFEDKDMLFTSKHRDRVVQNHARYFQNKSSTVKTASKYFDRHPTTITTATSSKTATDSNLDKLLHSSPKLSSTTSNVHQMQIPIKTKEKSLLSNVKSKLFSSSSNNQQNLPMSLSNSMSSSRSKSKRSEVVKSKIASLWKRSRSIHDKLDQSSQSRQLKDNASESSEILNAEVSSSSSSSSSMFNRLVPLRRSLANHEIIGKSNLIRSTTYDSLPTKHEDLVSRMPKSSKDNDDDPNQYNRFDGYNFGSLNNKKRTERTNNNNHQSKQNGQGNFTFMTFVKSSFQNKNNNNSPTDNIAPQKNDPSLTSNLENFTATLTPQGFNRNTNSPMTEHKVVNNNNSNDNDQQFSENNGSSSKNKNNDDHRHQKLPPAVGSSTATSGKWKNINSKDSISSPSASSTSSNRKTCLVTTV